MLLRRVRFRTLLGRWLSLGMEKNKEKTSQQYVVQAGGESLMIGSGICSAGIDKDH